VEPLAQALGLSRIHLVGTAAGGIVAFDDALSFSSRPRTLVVAQPRRRRGAAGQTVYARSRVRCLSAWRRDDCTSVAGVLLRARVTAESRVAASSTG
jgi:hypothetical protein